MSKKSHKALASATVMSLILTSTLTAVPVSAAASVERLEGAGRENTAVSVAKKAFAEAKTVVLVNGYGYADAVSATPLAKALNAPILLTNKVDKPTAELLATLKDLKAEKIVIVGGEGSVTKAMADELDKTYEVSRFGGASRYETNANVAKEVLKLTGKKEAFLVNGQDGYADALSVASIAATKGAPVLFANKNEVPAVVKAVAEGLEVSAVGGAAVLPSSVIESVKGTRVASGADRFATNLEVLKKYKDDLKFDNIYMAFGGATATQFADALVASAAAAKVGAPVVLSSNKNANAFTTNAKNYIKENLGADTKVYLVGGTGSLENAIFNDVKNIVNPVTGELTVSTIKAASASSFKVTFNKAVEDTSKLTFEVSRGTTPITATVNWNEAKTEATLVNSSNYPEGTYTVVVKNDSKEMKTEKIDIKQQKVEKIEITSTKLSVYRGKQSVTEANGTVVEKDVERGYATYKVYDQYGNDITTSYLATNIKFQTGVGEIEKKAGGNLIITPNSNTSLIQFPNVVITGYDTTTGTSITATLATSTVIGTLSDIKFGELKETLSMGDTGKVYYLPYTAYDMSGNETKNFELISKGLILTDNSSKVGGYEHELTVTNSNILSARLVQDPSESNNAAIEIRVKDNDDYAFDVPVTIMAMTFTGKNASLNTTVKRANRVDKIALMTPTVTVAEGDTDVEIPFEAFDQQGNKVTKVDDLEKNVTLTPAYNSGDNSGLKFERRADGTAKLVLKKVASAKSTMFLTANVKNTPNMSNITLNIQEKAYAEKIEVDSSVLVSAMEDGAQQKIDLGADKGGIKVKDQYGREIDMVSNNKGNTVRVKVSGDATVNNDVVDVDLENGYAVANIAAKNAKGGAATLTFTLLREIDGKKQEVDKKTVSLSIIKKDDIKGFTVNEVKDPIYSNNKRIADLANDPLTARDKAYGATLKVYGKTSGGTKVLLAGTPVVSVAVDNTNEFLGTTTDSGVNYAFDGGKVYAGKLTDSSKTGSSAVATVTIEHNNALHAVTTTIKSSTEAPKATAIGVDIEQFYTDPVTKAKELVVKENNDIVTITDVDKANFKSGAYMAKFDSQGKAVDECNVVLFAKDQ